MGGISPKVRGRRGDRNGGRLPHSQAALRDCSGFLLRGSALRTGPHHRQDSGNPKHVGARRCPRIRERVQAEAPHCLGKTWRDGADARVVLLRRTQPAVERSQLHRTPESRRSEWARDVLSGDAASPRLPVQPCERRSEPHRHDRAVRRRLADDRSEFTRRTGPGRKPGCRILLVALPHRSEGVRRHRRSGAVAPRFPARVGLSAPRRSDGAETDATQLQRGRRLLLSCGHGEGTRLRRDPSILQAVRKGGRVRLAREHGSRNTQLRDR